MVRQPPYYQPEWAGYVTAKTRAAVYDAAMQCPESIISFNTDGIYSLQPLQVRLGEGLGEWEQTQYPWFVSVQSGVYFTQDPEAGKAVEHYRGFDKGSLSPEQIIAAWSAGQPILEAELTRLVTLGQAIHHPSDESAFRSYFGSWRRAPRVLRLDQATGKRTHLREQELRQAAVGLVRTQPRSLGVCELSELMPLKWDPSSTLLDEVDEEYDGTLLSVVLADFTP